MQAFIYFSCIGYECQTFHPKMGMLRRHTHFVVVHWLNPKPSEKVPFFKID